jgi:hypothetical protein
MVVSGNQQEQTNFCMKTKTKSKRTLKTAGQKSGRTLRSPSAKTTEGRGLNTDEQNRVTNISGADEDVDEDRFQRLPVDDVEEEEERQQQRRVERARGEEEEK